MKLVYLLLIITGTCIGQIKSDSIKSSWYGRVMPYAIYTGYGKMVDRQLCNIEVGRTIGVMDFGLAVGKISQRPDSTNFLEAKVTMNVAQYGRFSNEMMVGCGYVFNSNNPLMLELSYTIFGQIYNKLSIGVVTGYYNLSGETQCVDKSFFGLAFRYGLQRDDNGGIINLRGKPKRHHFK